TNGQTATATDFVSTSSGAGDSGKVPKLDSNGHLATGFMVKFPNSQAFSGTSPSSYTDLDLSSIVGAAQHLVILAVITTGATRNFNFRRKGDTNAYAVLGGDGHYIVETDTNGVVQWISSAATGSTTVTVVAYF